jgi:hypothetical protein
MVRDQILVGVIFFAPAQTGPGAQPASCTMDTGLFPAAKWPRCDTCWDMHVLKNPCLYRIGSISTNTIKFNCATKSCDEPDISTTNLHNTACFNIILQNNKELQPILSSHILTINVQIREGICTAKPEP